MVDVSDFIAHSPNATRGQLSETQKERLNDALESLNGNLYGSDIGQAGGGGNAIPTQNLISYWPLDNLEDGTATDYVGSHDGTLVNDVERTTTTEDGAASFDGIDDVIETDLNVGNANQSLTVSGFLKAPDGQGFSGTNHFFLSNYVDRPHNGFFAIGSDDADRMFFWTRSHSLDHSVKVGPTEPAFDGQFHHYVGVRDAEEGEIRFYIDGEPQGTKQFPGNVAIKDEDSFFGMMQHYGSRNLSDIVDDVRIYDSALSNSEVADLYNNTPGGT